MATKKAPSKPKRPTIESEREPPPPLSHPKEYVSNIQIPDPPKDPISAAIIPKSRVFEKQFIILVCIIVVGTAVFAFNPYLILQGQKDIQNIVSGVAGLSKSIDQYVKVTVVQNAHQQEGIEKVIQNQNRNTKLLQEFLIGQRNQQNQLGNKWLNFINAMLVDMEQQQDEICTQTHIHCTDHIINNGTHIIFDHNAIEIIRGVPVVNLTENTTH